MVFAPLLPQTDAQLILVIEKDAVFQASSCMLQAACGFQCHWMSTCPALLAPGLSHSFPSLLPCLQRLLQQRFFDTAPCILVTGKG